MSASLEDLMFACSSMVFYWQKSLTPLEEMLTYPHEDGVLSYLKHGWNGWDSPGPVDASVVEVIVILLAGFCLRFPGLGMAWHGLALPCPCPCQPCLVSVALPCLALPF